MEKILKKYDVPGIGRLRLVYSEEKLYFSGEGKIVGYVVRNSEEGAISSLGNENQEDALKSSNKEIKRRLGMKKKRLQLELKNIENSLEKIASSPHKQSLLELFEVN